MQHSNGSSAPAVWVALFRLLIGSLFVGGAWLRWEAGLTAITTPDSMLYLGGALWGDVTTIAWRTFVYPLFIQWSVELFGSLAAVILLQKLLGLLTAALTFGAWMRLKAVVNYRPWGHVLHDALGLVLLAMMLISHGSTRYYEQSIMLEALSSLALALVVFSACYLFVAVRTQASARTTALWAGVLIGLSLFANTFNPRFSPLVILSVLIAVSALRLGRVPFRLAVASIVIPSSWRCHC